jgi:DNA-binding beta-propeller fold protein YncE
MKSCPALSLLACVIFVACAVLPAQQVPGATQLPDRPYAIKKTWIIGGAGNWDYLTADPTARRLFIAHSTQVQVVDLDTGTLSGQITGLREARDIALDDAGQLGYISDGADNQVKVFDRRSLQVVASIPTGPGPRALVLEPQTRLLFAVCTTPTARPAQTPNAPPVRESEIKTTITVIDTESRTPLAEILMPGRLGFAQTDGNGQVFVNIVNRNQVARIDAQSIAAYLRAHAAVPPAANSPGPANASGPPNASSPAKPADSTRVFDWSHESRLPNSAQSSMAIFALGSDCSDPRALAVDAQHGRLFAACNNMKMIVLNASTGEAITSLNTGPGTDAVAYDPDHSMIYVSNGGAQGSLTIIHQDVTDTYAVVQVLSTRQRARTLAVDRSNGQVLLVTDLLAVDLAEPGTIGSLKTAPASGSFQVLVISN